MQKNGFTTFFAGCRRRFFPLNWGAYVIFVLHSIPNASGHCRLFAWKKLSGHFKSPCHVWYAHAKCSAWWNVQVYYLLKHPLSKQVTYNVPFILSGVKLFKTGQARICTAKSMSNSNFKVFYLVEITQLHTITQALLLLKVHRHIQSKVRRQNQWQDSKITGTKKLGWRMIFFVF